MLRFILFGALLCTVIFIVENINGRLKMNDFKVYYSAAEALVQGEQVYGLPFGLDTGYYKYSPFTLLLFVPYTLFSFEVARVLHFILLSVCTISANILIYRILDNYFFEVQGKSGLLCLVLICILNHLFRELHLGNINVLLVLGVSMAAYFSLTSRPLPAGVLLGLIMVTKPYFLLLILPVIAYRKIRIFLALSVSILFFLVIPSLFIGWQENLLLHQNWVKSMLDHGSYLTSYNTIEYLIHRYIYAVNPGSLQYYVIAFAGLLYALFFWWSSKAEHNSAVPAHYSKRPFIIGIFLLTAIIPNLVITDTEHFLLSFPLIVLLICYLSNKKNYWLTAAFVVLIFFYGANSSDLIGKKLATQFDLLGVLGLSNLLIILAVVYLYLKESQYWRFRHPMEPVDNAKLASGQQSVIVQS